MGELDDELLDAETFAEGHTPPGIITEDEDEDRDRDEADERLETAAVLSWKEKLDDYFEQHIAECDSVTSARLRSKQTGKPIEVIIEAYAIAGELLSQYHDDLNADYEAWMHERENSAYEE